jgi:hypothetical protein
MPLIEQILHLPVIAGGLVLMAITTRVGLLAYYLSFRFLAVSQTKEARRATSGLFRVIGVLVSLFLSLTFADVMLELNQIEASVEREAVMLEDIHRDLGRYNTARALKAQTLLVDYIQGVIQYDWPALADDKLSKEVREILLQLEYEVLYLEDETEVQQILRPRIISDVSLVYELRLTRLEQALAKPPLFLIVVVFGFLVTMACFGPHPPNRLTVGLLTMYTSLIGLVIYLILAYSDPFQGSTGIDPVSLKYVLEQVTAN